MSSVTRHPEYRQAARALRAGNLREARRHSSRLASRVHDSAELLSLQAAIAVAGRRYREALEFIDAAECLAPGDAGILAHKANTLVTLRDYAGALQVADRALTAGPRRSEVFATLGSVFTRCDQHDKSLQCFREAADQDPQDPMHHYNLGTALRFRGDFAGAETCFDRVLRQRPGDFETYYARSGLRTQTQENNHVAELEALLERGIRDPRNETIVCYALAKELEDLRDWSRSFRYLQRGARLKRQHLRYDVQRDVAKMHALRSGFTKAILRRPRTGLDSAEPIFVIGLPRAGSTLVDRILSSHSRVSSAGELQNFAVESMRPIHEKLGTTQVPVEKLVEHTLDIDFAALGRRYLDSTRHLTGQCAHFVDKMPLNFLYVGLIHLALPNARIVHVRRNPMAACYAMLKTMFKGAYPFSYALDDLGHYYLAYHRLMEHWNNCFPGRMLNLDYEAIVEDQEGATRALLDYCGLGWEKACLDFHELQAPSTTASAVEVRRPLYSSSVARWKRFEGELKPLAAFFREHGLQPGAGS